MRKKSLLALLLALTVILSGCALIKKDEAVDAATVIVALRGEEITKAQIQKEVNSRLDYTAQVYAYLYDQAYDTTDAKNISSAQDAAIDSAKESLAERVKFRELGLAALTDEEVQAEAESLYMKQIRDFEASEFPDSLLSQEELDAEAKAHAEEEHQFTLSSMTDTARASLITKKVMEAATADIQVTDEQVDEEYASKVTADKASYGENASSCATALNNGTTVYYAPAGIRRVKQILIRFAEEDRASASAAYSTITSADTEIASADTDIASADADTAAAQAILDNAEATEDEKKDAEEKKAAAEENKTAAEAKKADAEAKKADAEAVIKAALEKIAPEADAVLASLNDGADWDTLMAEKTQDPGMKRGDTAKTGYAVCEGMSRFDAAFVNAAMALEKVGDVSDKIPSNAYGYYIIRYESDVQEGEIGPDNVKEDLRSSMLETAKDKAYESILDSWVQGYASEYKVDKAALNN